MSARASLGRRVGLTPVRLSDIPIGVRRHAGAPVARVLSDDGRLMERVELERAIEFPSETVYWIPTGAYEDAKGKRTWR